MKNLRFLVAVCLFGCYAPQETDQPSSPEVVSVENGDSTIQFLIHEAGGIDVTRSGPQSGSLSEALISGATPLELYMGFTGSTEAEAPSALIGNHYKQQIEPPEAFITKASSSSVSPLSWNCSLNDLKSWHGLLAYYGGYTLKPWHHQWPYSAYEGVAPAGFGWPPYMLQGTYAASQRGLFSACPKDGILSIGIGQTMTNITGSAAVGEGYIFEYLWWGSGDQIRVFWFSGSVPFAALASVFIPVSGG